MEAYNHGRWYMGFRARLSLLLIKWGKIKLNIALRHNFENEEMDIEFELDWSIGLGAGQKIKKTSVSGIFLGKVDTIIIVRFQLHYKPTKFDQNCCRFI